MCRNIRILHHFDPPTTPDEVRAAATQYVRKVSGQTRPPRADDLVFAQAVEEITAATNRLLEALPVRGLAKTREGEREKARRRFAARR